MNQVIMPTGLFNKLLFFMRRFSLIKPSISQTDKDAATNPVTEENNNPLTDNIEKFKSFNVFYRTKSCQHT